MSAPMKWNPQSVNISEQSHLRETKQERVAMNDSVLKSVTTSKCTILLQGRQIQNFAFTWLTALRLNIFTVKRPYL